MPILTKVTVLTILLAMMSTAPADEPRPVGTRAGEWEVSDWLNSKPLTLKGLRGRVILVRWWAAPGCPFCEATAPALNEFHKRYQDRGLVVVGLYHHKARTALDVAKVKESADKFGFRFPVAIDRDWRTLKRWWLDGAEQRWTSVTFLIDRSGVVRHVHPGGAYVKGDRAYQEIEARIEQLLKEK
ncbi:MAG: redoxin family protein [Gemmataceae bacterium]|nr:redoxin family protein [Gemmataceae bacterium]